MRIAREDLESLVFDRHQGRRFTQDSPVMPDVWFGFGDQPAGRLPLLLLPRRDVRPASLSLALQGVPAAEAAGSQDVAEVKAPPEAAAMAAARIAYDESYVVADLSLEELLRIALPLTGWWDTHPGRLGGLSARNLERLLTGEASSSATSPSGCWFLELVGTLLWAADQPGDETCQQLPEPKDYCGVLARALRGLRRPLNRQPPPALVWSVNRNRESEIAVWSSTRTVKADAARRLFATSCSHLTWAVLDTGIDATHPAFAKRTTTNRLRTNARAPASISRVIKTYDFTRIRDLLHESAGELPEHLGGRAVARAAELRRRLLAGQSIDWELLEPLLELPHDASYSPPGHAHGTHVAGLLGGDWRQGDPDYDAHEEFDLTGICPDIGLYDLRVLGDDGTGDEFSILAALQFVRWLNAHKRRPAIQGVNLSLSIPHDVANYACGRTPVCEEAARVHASGVAVVAAAGNRGYVQYLLSDGRTADAYRNISITDPGNTEQVITVGATHRRHPHTYGVSYFSSRGPTGDGRAKPDLVAPGEKVKGPVPDRGAESMDGTSMAAPHVSGAAALIMARHPEFIGDPNRIKQVLCDTATDLGREHYFQGAGLVDVCRALQSI